MQIDRPNSQNKRFTLAQIYFGLICIANHGLNLGGGLMDIARRSGQRGFSRPYAIVIYVHVAVADIFKGIPYWLNSHDYSLDELT